MAEKNYTGKNTLSHFLAKLKILFQEKVDKVEGKGLSQNDLTNDLKAKYDTAVSKVDQLTETGGAPNVIEIVKVNGNALTPDGDKAVNIPVPTKISELTNDSNYQTAEQVNTAISSAIGDIQGIEYSIVTSLPSIGEVGIIYLVSNGGDNSNIYDEYIWANNAFEKIGTTAVDLSGYLKDTDLVEITNDEIDEMMADW